MEKKWELITDAFLYKDGKMLGAKRSANRKFLPNKWELPGGHVEFGEQLEEALAREIKEELNLEIKVGEALHGFTYKRNDWIEGASMVFACEVLDPENLKTQEDEVAEVRWFSEEEALATYDMDFEKKTIKLGFARINKK